MTTNDLPKPCQKENRVLLSLIHPFKFKWRCFWVGRGEGVGTRPTLHWRYCTFLLYMRMSLLLVVLFLKWERERKKEKENVRSSVSPVALAAFCNVSGLRWLRHSPMGWNPGVCTPPGTICLVFCVLYTYIIVFFIFMGRLCSKKRLWNLALQYWGCRGPLRGHGHRNGTKISL